LRTVFVEPFSTLLAARGWARLRLAFLAVFSLALLVAGLREPAFRTAFFVAAGLFRRAALFLAAAGFLVVFLAFCLATADGPLKTRDRGNCLPEQPIGARGTAKSSL
jgi:hypothetical protein